MKLLTHNMLSSNGLMDGVKNGFPLTIKAKDVAVTEVDFSADFIARIIPKLDWRAVRSGAADLNVGPDLSPDPPGAGDDPEVLRRAHHVLLEVDVVSGDLVCPETGTTVFKIENGKAEMVAGADDKADRKESKVNNGSSSDVDGLAAGISEDRKMDITLNGGPIDDYNFSGGPLSPIGDRRSPMGRMMSPMLGDRRSPVGDRVRSPITGDRRSPMGGVSPMMSPIMGRRIDISPMRSPVPADIDGSSPPVSPLLSRRSPASDRKEQHKFRAADRK